MNEANKRKGERLYRPASVKLMIGDRTFAVHNLSVDGVGFVSDDPLPFKIDERLPMTIELQGSFVEMEGHVMHLSPISDLRSNVLLDKERYLCGVGFEPDELEAREAIASFVDSRLQEKRAS
jgi:hypothetical protein